MTYELTSLRLVTDFDRPVEDFVVPGIVLPGITKSLYIVDGIGRAPKHRGRALRPTGLLGLRVSNPELGLRVRLKLVVDTEATSRWATSRSAPPEDPAALEVNGHRLIEVRAQGRPKALVFLSARTDGTTQQIVNFDVPSEEIGSSRVLWVSLEGHQPAAEWARAGLLSDCLVGVHTARIEIMPMPVKPVRASLAVGEPPRTKTRQRTVSLPRFVVINPGSSRGKVTVSLQPERSLGESGPRIDGSLSVRPARLSAHAVSWSGQTLFEGWTECGANGDRVLRVANSGEPVLVYFRTDTLDSCQPSNSTDWLVSVRSTWAE